MKDAVISDGPADGFRIEITEMNLVIFVYESQMEPGRTVIEIETDSDSRPTAHSVRHDPEGRPQIKVMINEGIVSNDGGQEPISSKECVVIQKYQRSQEYGGSDVGLEAIYYRDGQSLGKEFVESKEQAIKWAIEFYRFAPNHIVEEK